MDDVALAYWLGYNDPAAPNIYYLQSEYAGGTSKFLDAKSF